MPAQKSNPSGVSPHIKAEEIAVYGIWHIYVSALFSAFAKAISLYGSGNSLRCCATVFNILMLL